MDRAGHPAEGVKPGARVGRQPWLTRRPGTESTLFDDSSWSPDTSWFRVNLSPPPGHPPRHARAYITTTTDGSTFLMMWA